MKIPNTYTSREAWLRAATNELRPHFASYGYTLPDNIRFAIAFTSGGKRGREGECWHPESSADNHFEIDAVGHRHRVPRTLGGKEVKALARTVAHLGKVLFV